MTEVAAVRELPSVAVTVAVPAELLFSVAVALPSLSVASEAVTVPRSEEKLIVVPTTGLPLTVSTACRVIVAASVSSAMMVDVLDEMLRLIPLRVITEVSVLPPTEAWTVPLPLRESAASAVNVVVAWPLASVVAVAGLTEPGPALTLHVTV